MFERFTSGARQVLVGAQRHATLLRHSFIYREHLLMTLLDDAEANPDGVCAAVLDSGGAPREDWGLLIVQAAELRESGAREQFPEKAGNRSQPFAVETKKVLELSLREALQLGHNYIAEFHVLLALIQAAGLDSDDAWSTLIDNGGLEIDRAREMVAADARSEAARQPRRRTYVDVPGRPARPSRPERRGSAQSQASRPRVGPVSDGYRAVVNKAEKYSASATTTGDLLLALLDVPGTHAELALATASLPDRALIESEVDRLRSTGTPDGFDRPRVRVHKRSGAVIIRDPRIAELMSQPPETQSQEDHDELARLVQEALRERRSGDVVAEGDDSGEGSDE